MKNLIKVFGIIALVAVIGFSFAACGNGKNGGGNGGGGNNSGWPPSSVLSEFGLSGMSAPSGTSNSEWGRADTASNYSMSIRWDGSSAHDNYIIGKLESNGWVLQSQPSVGNVDIQVMYKKEDFGNVNYYRANGTRCQFTVLKQK